MSDLGVFVDEAAEKLREILFDGDCIEIPVDVVSKPLNKEFFNEKLFQEGFSLNLNLSTSKMELVLRRIFIDLVNGFENNLTKICVLLDLCYYLKFSSDEDQVKIWSSLFFDLSACCIQTIPFPNDLLNFYPYLDSRLSWYLEGTSKDSVPHGETNLKMGIRPPAAKIFFSVDIFLKNLDSYSKFNSPRHYELLHKILCWVSQLIPINDHCNINRKAKIMDSYPESLWLPNLPELSSPPTLLSDWINISDQLFLKPLDWLYLPPREKSNIESILHRFVDEVLVYEAEYYNLIRKKNEKNIRDQAAVNGKEYYPLNFPHEMFYNGPKDSRKSISASKISFWGHFNSFFEESEQIIQPLPFEIDLFDLKAFQDNIEAYEYNYFRKLVLLQLYVMLFLLKEILSVDPLRQYYGKIMAQTTNKQGFASRMESIESKSNANDASINFLDKKLHRISLFYEKKDPTFYNQLIAIAKSEVNSITQKISDFSTFKGVNWSSDPIKDLEFPQSFKKFGWIKLGDKKLDGLWKTQSGLDLAEKFSKQNRKSPDGIYKELISANVDTEESTTDEYQQEKGKSQEEVIINQWKTLRSIRASHVFELNKINEKTGLAGFSNAGLIEEDILRREKLLDKRLEEKKSTHLKLLEEAESYFHNQELEKKQALEEKLNAQREAFKSAKADRAKAEITSNCNKRLSDTDHGTAEQQEIKRQKTFAEENNTNEKGSTSIPETSNSQNTPEAQVQDQTSTIMDLGTADEAPRPISPPNLQKSDSSERAVTEIENCIE